LEAPSRRAPALREEPPFLVANFPETRFSHWTVGHFLKRAPGNLILLGPPLGPPSKPSPLPKRRLRVPERKPYLGGEEPFSDFDPLSSSRSPWRILPPEVRGNDGVLLLGVRPFFLEKPSSLRSGISSGFSLQE